MIINKEHLMNRYLANIITIAILAFFVGSSCGASQTQAQAEVKNIKGVLIESKAPVEFKSPKGTPVNATMGTELLPGTKIQAGSGGMARVMLMDGTIVEVSSGKSYTVGTVPESSEDRTVMRGITLALNEAADVSVPPRPAADTAVTPTKPKAEPRIHGMVKMGGPLITQRQIQQSEKKKPVAPQKRLEAIYPTGTSIILPDRLTFKWNIRANFPKPVVILTGSGSEKQIDVDTKNPFTASASSKDLGLKRGQKYTWYLASKNDKPGRAKSQRFNFTVLTERQEDDLKKDLQKLNDTASSPEGRDFLKAQLYYNYGMNYNMVDTLTPLWKKNHSSSIKKLLLLGYSKMGRAEEAWRYK